MSRTAVRNSGFRLDNLYQLLRKGYSLTEIATKIGLHMRTVHDLTSRKFPEFTKAAVRERLVAKYLIYLKRGFSVTEIADLTGSDRDTVSRRIKRWIHHKKLPILDRKLHDPCTDHRVGLKQIDDNLCVTQGANRIILTPYLSVQLAAYLEYHPQYLPDIDASLSINKKFFVSTPKKSLNHNIDRTLEQVRQLLIEEHSNRSIGNALGLSTQRVWEIVKDYFRIYLLDGTDCPDRSIYLPKDIYQRKDRVRPNANEIRELRIRTVVSELGIDRVLIERFADAESTLFNFILGNKPDRGFTTIRLRSNQISCKKIAEMFSVSENVVTKTITRHRTLFKKLKTYGIEDTDFPDWYRVGIHQGPVSRGYQCYDYSVQKKRKRPHGIEDENRTMEDSVANS